MRIEKRKRDQASVVQVDGEVDLDVSADLRTALLQELAQEDVYALVLDLSGVRYLDSSGVAVLLEVLREAQDQSKRLVVCGLSEQARGVLRLTRLLALFEHYPTQAEALGALG